MILIAFLLGIAEPAVASIQPPSTAPQAPTEPSKFPIVREINKIGGRGSTLIGFNIDKNGKAFGCTVLEPSGSTVLDEKACEIMMDKGKFRPTINDKGKPVPTYGKTVRIRWNIEG
jgi:TonB family protein